MVNDREGGSAGFAEAVADLGVAEHEKQPGDWFYVVGGGVSGEIVARGVAFFTAEFELAVLVGEGAFRFVEFELCEVEAHFGVGVVEHDFVEATFVEARLER